jgi:hypothetical protein
VRWSRGGKAGSREKKGRGKQEGKEAVLGGPLCSSKTGQKLAHLCSQGPSQPARQAETRAQPHITHRHMMFAEPMSPLVPNLTASLFTLISTAIRAGRHTSEQSGR